MPRFTTAGKQFLGQPTKIGKHPSSFFEPAPHKWVFDGVVYVDKQRYAEVQLEKKKGFLVRSSCSLWPSLSPYVRSLPLSPAMHQHAFFVGEAGP